MMRNIITLGSNTSAEKNHSDYHDHYVVYDAKLKLMRLLLLSSYSYQL